MEGKKENQLGKEGTRKRNPANLLAGNHALHGQQKLIPVAHIQNSLDHEVYQREKGRYLSGEKKNKKNENGRRKRKKVTVKLLEGLLAGLVEAIADLSLGEAHLEQALGLLKQLSTKDNNKVCAVSDLLLLLVRAKHQDLAGWVNNVHLPQHGGGIIGHKELVKVVHNHLVLAYIQSP